MLLVYPKIGGENIKYFVKNIIQNLLRANIDVRSRRNIVEFPGDGMKFISKLQSHYTNMTFAGKVGMTEFPASNT